MISELVKLAYNAIDEKKGNDIRVIDISKISSISDYFIIASGNNIRQVQSISDNITEILGKNGFNYKSIEGFESGSWILIDYGDVIIHIFNQEDRRFYDLERIWRDGVTIPNEEIMIN